MKKFVSQLFASKQVHGKQMIYLFRIMSETTLTGALIPFTTEDTMTISADGDTTATKDGPITVAGSPEIEFSKNAILSVDSEDVTAETMADKLKEAVLHGTTVELWEANLARPTGTANKYKGTYYQGTMSEFELTASAEDLAEVSFTYKANGLGADGDVTVTQEQIEIASYDFKDTTASTTSTQGA